MHRIRLQNLFILLAVAITILTVALEGCRWMRPYDRGNSYNTPRPYPPGPSKLKTLRVVLQGPFVALVRQELHNRITAYLPKDADGVHQFRFPDSGTSPTGSKNYHFELLSEGLEISQDRPYVDHGFDDFNVTLDNWPPKNPPENYVVLDLPTPDVITYIPPLEEVVFGTTLSSSRVGHLPSNYVLEYKVRDGSKVMMRSPELGSRPPTDCEKGGRDGYRERAKPGIEPCEQSASYYFGVTLPLDWNSQNPAMDLEEHAKAFFNDKVLPSLFGSAVPDDKKLLRVGVDPSRDRSHIGSAPMIMPAVFRVSQFSGPRMIDVSVNGPAVCLPAAIIATTLGGITASPSPTPKGSHYGAR